jgi:hypothetical protein
MLRGCTAKIGLNRFDVVDIETRQIRYCIFGQFLLPFSFATVVALRIEETEMESAISFENGFNEFIAVVVQGNSKRF